MNPDAFEYRRGESDPVSRDHVVDVADPDVDVEYDVECGTVRYVAGLRTPPPGRRTERSSGGEPDEGLGADAPDDQREPISRSRSFEHWAATTARRVGHEVAEAVVCEALGTGDCLSAGVSSGYGDDLVVTVTHRRTVDRRGHVVFEPTVAFDDVVRVAPSAVSVTVMLEDSSRPIDLRRRTVETPVWVERQECQLN